MKNEFDRIKFRYGKNRKLKNTTQIAKLKSYISGLRAIETFSDEIAEMANNPFISHDPEAILLNLKDYCTRRVKFSIDEKNKAHTELKALIEIQYGQEPEGIEDQEDILGFQFK
jgi:hypothetical protein